MSRPTQIIVRTPGDEPPHVVQVALEAEESDLLGRYVNEAETLRSWPQLADAIRARFNFNYKADSGVAIEVLLPPWDLVGILLHRLRPFILERESYSFLKIQSVLGKGLSDPAIRAYLGLQRDAFPGRVLRSQIQVTSNGVEIISESVLLDWLNGFEYHRDEVRRARLDELHRLMPLDMSKYFFISMLTDKIRAVLNVSGLAAVTLGSHESFTVDPRAQAT